LDDEPAPQSGSSYSIRRRRPPDKGRFPCRTIDPAHYYGVYPPGDFSRFVAGFGMVFEPTERQANMTDIHELPLGFHRYGHMVQEYYVERVRQAERRRRAAREKLRTRADVRRLQEQLRREIRRCFGPAPARTPPNVRITGTIRDRRYRIDKLLLQSRPGFYVSANLYVPEGLKRPAPGVLGVCGHSDIGKAAPAYQGFMQGLACKGFVGLMYDPIGQGERVQYPGSGPNRRRLELCAEHNMVGHQLSLVGEFFGMWRAWDGIRALDYLLSRPEVDPERIGVTGNSGGGTMTTWLCGLDDRITMAAPSCFVTTLLRNLENEYPADVEQIPPGMIRAGMDEFEMFIPFAPRPLILLTQENDSFDHRGSVQAYEELRRIYRLLGAERNLRLVSLPGRHSLPREARERMYAFFARHAGRRVRPAEPRLVNRSPEQLAATPSGSVQEEGSKRVLDFTRQRADDLARRRGRPGRRKLRTMLPQMLALPPRNGPPDHRILRQRFLDGINYQGYAIDTEPGIQAIVTMAAPEGVAFRVPRDGACSLLVPDLAAIDELRLPAVRKLLGRRRHFAVDVRGIGLTTSAACRGEGFFASYDSEYFHNAYALLLGEPYIGRRVHDLLCVLDWLAANAYREIHLFGRGMGAVLAALAAVVDPRPRSVTLIHPLLSWTELAQTPVYNWPASSMLGGALERFDLPDCYRALVGKLRLISPFDARRRRLPRARARSRLERLGLPADLLGKEKL